VSRILNTPRGREMMLDMQEKQVELAIDPIQQKLAEYADVAVDKLYELVNADAENVQRQAAKDILEMAGYTPKRNVVNEREQAPTIIVGQINLRGDDEPPRYTAVEAANGKQHNGAGYASQEQERNVSQALEIVQRADFGQGRGERDGGQASEDGPERGERVQCIDSTNEERYPAPGQRWVSEQGWDSADDV